VAGKPKLPGLFNRRVYSTLKLPLGSLTGLFGILLVNAGFIPGLSDLDSPAQILAWAVIFGYGQELFTRLVDQRGQTVLDQVPIAEASSS